VVAPDQLRVVFPAAGQDALDEFVVADSPIISRNERRGDTSGGRAAS